MTALATVAALPGVAVLCESVVPTRSALSRGWNLIWNLPESSRVSASLAVTAWPKTSATRDGGRGARRTGFGAGHRRGMAVVLAVAALACWFGKCGTSPFAPSGDAVSAALAVVAEQLAATKPAGSQPVTGHSGAAYYARAIETIQTGQRVLARNPELAGAELPEAPVDPATWVKIRLRMPKPTGDFLEITLLRPVEWLAGGWVAQRPLT